MSEKLTANTVTSEKRIGERVLEVRGLSVEFHPKGRVVKAVENVDLHLDRGETVALVGESGSGKSVTARALLGIVDPPGRIVSGSIVLNGTDILSLPPKQLSARRGSEIAMVFQDALSSLNPVFTVGYQIAEVFRRHLKCSHAEAWKRAVEMLDLVKIPAAAERARRYPHEFSGGMRQRAMIAIGLALDPDVLVADEPTTALDVTVQAQIMNLLAEIQKERQMGILLITHDLGVVATVADRVQVMYAGRIAESAPVLDLYQTPAHAYSRALLDAIPRIDRDEQDLATIPGAPPSLIDVTPGCSFAPRCTFATEQCRNVAPALEPITADRLVACHEWERVIAWKP